jgi:hypothetical protein
LRPNLLMWSIVPMRVSPGLLASVAVVSLFHWDATAAEEAGVSNGISLQRMQEVDARIDRALTFIAAKQRANGSFEAPDEGQPGVTALALLAFMSRGHVPGSGTYGRQIDAAVNYIITCQKANGMLSAIQPTTYHRNRGPSHTVAYNHPIAGLALCEAYGMSKGAPPESMRNAIIKSINVVIKYQELPKARPVDQGGWHYFNTDKLRTADLSVTSWQLLFLRSAMNAGFEVPAENVDAAMRYIRNCFDPVTRSFMYYALAPGEPADKRDLSRGMLGAGIFGLALGGEHHTPEARMAAQYLVERPFRPYNETVARWEMYHYSVLWCSLGMYQAGSPYWERFYPPLVDVLLENQAADGSWGPEGNGGGRYGLSYSTAVTVLALSPPYGLLPVFQR